MPVIVVAVSGVTNGGKTTLAQALHKTLPSSKLVCQDEYFLPKDSPLHTLIPELNHINWEIMSSLDMEKMWKDITKILENATDTQSPLNDTCSITTLEAEEVSVLIIEGFLVLNYKPIADICDLKYHLTLSKEQCWERRRKRVYDPPDVPGFFDHCVWPEYERHRDEMLKSVSGVRMIDGTGNIDEIIKNVLEDIDAKIKM